MIVYDSRREEADEFNADMDIRQRMEERSDAVEPRGREEAHEEGDGGGKTERVGEGGESDAREVGERGESDQGGERGGREDREREGQEAALTNDWDKALAGRCQRCGEPREFHAMVPRFFVGGVGSESETVVESVFLICANSTFEPYR
jgi:hypothetical protein